MVAGSAVQSDFNSLKEALNRYSNEINGLSSSWTGSSHDNLVSKSEEFLSEYLSTIQGEMDSFAAACDLYEDYKNVKTSLSQARSLYNQAVSNNDSANIQKYNSDISLYDKQLTDLKSQIESNLASASAATLSAISLSGDVRNGAVLKTSSNEVAQKAVEWALKIAADDSYGYESGGYPQLGNHGFDCSSLINQAYENAGVPLGDVKYYTNNASMVNNYLPFGFEWHEGTPNVDELEPGDILVNLAHHVEMYVGDGKKVGAHDNWSGGSNDGDPGGQEINVNDYENFHNGGWDGYLRYVGKNA